MYTAIANARMRRHVTQYKHKVQPRGWTNKQFQEQDQQALEKPGYKIRTRLLWTGSGYH